MEATQIHPSKIQERLDATRRRYLKEVAQTEGELAAAYAGEGMAYAAVCAAEKNGDEDEIDAAIHAHFRAIDRRNYVKDKLARLSHESELARRLEQSEKLARRFA